MKKLLLIALIFSITASALVGCSLNQNQNPENEQPPEITDPAIPETFVYVDMSLILPGDFYAVDGTSDTFKNDDYLIRATSISKSSITPNPGYDFPTLKVFFSNYIIFKDELNYQTEDGILYVDYSTNSSNVTGVFAIPNSFGTQFVAFFETDKSFYAVSVYSSDLEYSVVKAQALEWMKKITFAA